MTTQYKVGDQLKVIMDKNKYFTDHSGSLVEVTAVCDYEDPVNYNVIWLQPDEDGFINEENFEAFELGQVTDDILTDEQAQAEMDKHGFEYEHPVEICEDTFPKVMPQEIKDQIEEEFEEWINDCGGWEAIKARGKDVTRVNENVRTNTATFNGYPNFRYRDNKWVEVVHNKENRDKYA